MKEKWGYNPHMDFSKIRYKRSKIYISVIFGLIAMCVVLTCEIQRESIDVQKEVASQVIRLHVRANSNSSIDQNRKILVRDAVVGNLAQYKDDMTNVTNAKVTILNHLGDIQRAAVVALSGEEIKVSFENAWFPKKSYGDVVLPKGLYQSVIVEVGSGQGDNWWCVLFPQLCFIDGMSGYLPEESKAELEEELTEKTYEKIVDQSAEVKFKIIQWIQGIIQ